MGRYSWARYVVRTALYARKAHADGTVSFACSTPRAALGISQRKKFATCMIIFGTSQAPRDRANTHSVSPLPSPPFLHSSILTDLAYFPAHILAPSVFARLPLVHRIPALKIPVTFVYGSHDWMDPSGGDASIKAMRKAGNKEGRIYLVPGAGHHGASSVLFLLLSISQTNESC